MIQLSQRARLCTVAVIATTLGACTPSGGDGGKPVPTSHVRVGDGTLVVGTLLTRPAEPSPVQLAMLAGVAAAVADINAAGGVNGTPITQIDGDAGDGVAPIAAAALTPLATADVVIGPAAITGDPALAAGLDKAVLISPASLVANTDADHGFRTAASREQVIAATAKALTAAARTKVVVVAPDDEASQGLATSLIDALGDSSALAEPVSYPTTGAQHVITATKVKSAAPDAVVVLGGTDLDAITTQLTAQGLGPASLPLYVPADTVPALDPEGTAFAGSTVLVPGAAVNADLQAKLSTVNPALPVTTFAAEAYDAAVVAALAAVAAKDDDGAQIAAALPSVTAKGSPCTTYADCSSKLAAGDDISYEGATGPVAFDKFGNRGKASVGVYTVGEANAITPAEFVAVG